MNMTSEHVDALNELRLEISAIDRDILGLLEERMASAKVVGDIKKIYNKPFYVPEVEKKKIKELSAECRYPGLVEAIWPVIMCYTRTVE